MSIHIVAPQDYAEWNTFLSHTLRALCGVVIKSDSEMGARVPWTEFPCETNPDRVCPHCRDHPEYAMILLRGDEDLYDY